MGIGNEDQTAFSFEGSWKEFAPIALSNALLTIVTLSFYRFWATTRERQYFWSQTRFIDDRLEWTGTGGELFRGFLLALLIFGLPWLILSFGLQAMILQGYTAAASVIGVLVFLIFIMLPGIARFRALRYRLSRTRWHGIRGGSDDPGIAYGFATIWRTIVGFLPLGIMIPWSMTTLWRERWNKMSFGPHLFRSNPQWSNLLGRFLLCGVGPIALAFGAVIVAVPIIMASGQQSGFSVGLILFLIIAVYASMVLFPVAYYAAFFREVVNTLELSTLEFSFTARTKDWILLFLGHGGLGLLALIVAFVIATPFGLMADVASLAPGDTLGVPLAIGLVLAFLLPFSLVMPFVRYRNWRFFIRHMEAGGEINLETLTQSTTKATVEGEGLLDALDIGAF